MSAHRIALSRVQYGLFATPFEELIAADNPVRAIDAFVDYLDLEKLGFSHMKPEERGAPPYHPSVLLKLYLYGYYNRIRSSRMLERECGRNIELMWLLGQQKPSYHTIADFRSEEGHPKALKLVFRQLVQFCREAELIGGERIAIDGSKFRAQNSMKNNFNADKLDRQIEYNEKKFADYIDQFDTLDAAAENYPDASDALLTKAEAVMNRIDFHKELQQKLLKTGETQVSLIDPDARALPLHMGIVQVGYNLQSAVDDRHNLLVHLELTNQKDTNQLAPVAIETKGILQVDSLTALADKGYHQGESLDICHQNGIETCVAPLEYAPAADTGKFRKEDFIYDEKADHYLCPNQQKLTTNGTKYERKNKKGDVQYTFKRYDIDTKTCENCPLAAKCLSNNESKYRHKRHIDRNEFDPAIERNRRFVEANKPLYRRRQAMVEHPFGTLKRSWGFTYTLLRGLEKVSGEFGIIGSVYNLRRLVSILGVVDLQKRFRDAVFPFFVIRRTTDAPVGKNKTLVLTSAVTLDVAA